MTSAAHYDAQYTNGAYAECYTELPAWAVAANQWHVDLVIGLLGLHPEDGPILDLGSGRGHMMAAWERRGFATEGIELSSVAVRSSGRKNIHCGDASDLRGFADDQFQLVYSSAFLEHIPDELVARMATEQLRIARYGAHYIADERGNDPTHINIKPPAEWRAFFSQYAAVSLVAQNVMFPFSPPFLQLRELPAALGYAVQLAACRQQVTGGA